MTRQTEPPNERFYIIISRDAHTRIAEYAIRNRIPMNQLVDEIMTETPDRPYRDQRSDRWAVPTSQLPLPRNAMVRNHVGHVFVKNTRIPIRCRCCDGPCRKVFNWRGIVRCGCDATLQPSRAA